MIYTIDTSTPAALDWGASGDARIAQNVRNLISTWRYEVGYDRTKGLDPSIIDKPSEEAKALFIAEIYRLVEAHEPNTKIKEASVISINPQGQIDFKVVIEI